MPRPQFQSTLPQGERRDSTSSPRWADHFNPRSRKGSDAIKKCKGVIRGISIHAPARGATQHGQYGSQTGNISIHAPARGATQLCSGVKQPSDNFNPRSRKGSDSATIPPTLAMCLFQSTLPQGERRIIQYYGYVISPFQSTLPQGERPWLEQVTEIYWGISIHAPARGATSVSVGYNYSNNDFNPRSRKGSDPSWPCSSTMLSISIHAPARGATVSFAASAAAENISIHAPARGATFVCCLLARASRFQSTLPQGERHDLITISDLPHPISIHAPARGATKRKRIYDD